jgi:O-antigen/teichoic acid export membrane protein
VPHPPNDPVPDPARTAEGRRRARGDGRRGTTPDPLPSGLSRALLRGGAIALLIQGGGQLLRYLWQLGFARWMGVEEYGSFSFAFGWIQVLAILCALGLTTGTLRFIPEYLSNREWGLLRGMVRRSSQVTLAAGVGIALLGTLVLLALPVGEGRRQTLLLGMWLVPLLGLGNLKLEITRATREVGRAYFPMRIVLPAVAALLGFLAQSGARSLSAAQGLYALSGALILTLLLQETLLRQALPVDGRRARPVFRTRYWLSESFPLLLIAGFVILLNQTDILMVGALAGDQEVGLYAGAAVTARWVSFMLLSANAVAAPMIAGLHAQDDGPGLQALVTRVARWTFWPSLLLAAGFILGAGPILRLFGGEFAVARWALVILVLGQLVNASMGPVGHLMNLTGHGRDSARVYGTAAVVNIALNLLLIPPLGMEGAALATATSVALWNVWLFVLVRRKVGIHSFFLWGPA